MHPQQQQKLLVILAEESAISWARTPTEFERLFSVEERSTNSSGENTTLAELTRLVERRNMLLETGFWPTSNTICRLMLRNSDPLVMLLLLRNLVEVTSPILSKTSSTAFLF